MVAFIYEHGSKYSELLLRIINRKKNTEEQNIFSIEKIFCLPN